MFLFTFKVNNKNIMISNDCNLSSVVVRDNPESCIFCLEGEPQPTLYEGACKCHPLIHNSCISEWHKINPNSCPICLKGLRTNSNVIIVVEPSATRNMCLIFCFTCCLTLYCSPLIFVTVLLAIYHPFQRSHPTFTNTTIGN